MDTKGMFMSSHEFQISYIDKSRIDNYFLIENILEFIEASGNPQAVPEGMRMCRDNGIYVIVGQYSDHGNIEINPHLDIRGCWGCDFSHLYKSIHVINRYASEFKLEKAISRYYSLEEAQKAIEDVEALHVIKAVIAPGKTFDPS
jgi:threonine dehydrogenase-like Zn-dependent dehydrogenase